MDDFKPFPKIPRLSNECMVITEKIDGTNAQVVIADDLTVRAGSRNRWITPGADNYGFAGWVEQNKEELKKLGPGTHYGEWWGIGIQRGYGIFERRFSLFNTMRWEKAITDGMDFPKCCQLVPVIYKGQMDSKTITTSVETLQLYGSCAAPGFFKPEGICIYFATTKMIYKRLIENDTKHKWQVAEVGQEVINFGVGVPDAIAA